MSAQVEWARLVKDDLVQLQKRTQVPAIWAAAQLIHEAFNGDGSLSALAERCHNYAGIKWASWQAEYGGRPVRMETCEFIDGARQDLKDAFCALPTWQAFLEMYAALLTGNYYGPACLPYAADPLLFGSVVVARGYATDPAYLVRVACWMKELYPIYTDTLPGHQAPPIPAITVELPDGTEIAGELRGDTSWAPVRPLVESIGGVVTWHQTGPRVIVKNGECCHGANN